MRRRAVEIVAATVKFLDRPKAEANAVADDIPEIDDLDLLPPDDLI